MSSAESSGPPPKKRRSVRKTCEPCKLRSSPCSASLPCQQCVDRAESTLCHYRGGLRLNALQRSSQTSKPGTGRPLKATRLNLASQADSSSQPNPGGADRATETHRTRPPAQGPEPRKDDQRKRDRSYEPPRPSHEPSKHTHGPDQSTSIPSPLDALALLANEAASQEARSARGSSNTWPTGSYDASEQVSIPPKAISHLPAAKSSGQLEQRRSSLQDVPDGDQAAPGTDLSRPVPIVLPFFRYFGNTAIAPGLRCVEIEIQDEQTTLLHNHQVSDSAASVASSHGSPLDVNNLLTSQSLTAPPGAGQTDVSSPGARSNRSAESRGSSSRLSRLGSQESARRELFDAANGSLPAKAVLQHLLPLFFEGMACHFPFLSEERIMHDFEHGLLEPLEANCLAALACRFVAQSDISSLSSSHQTKRNNLAAVWSERDAASEDAYVRAEPFADKAKELVYPLFSLPSLKVCQALVMITWIEWGSDRDSSAWLWSGLSIRMSQDIGLSYWDSLEAVPEGEARRVHRLTFWAVYFLDRVISYGAGRRVTIAQSDIEIELPSSQECHASRSRPAEPSASHPWPFLMQLLGHRGNISDWLNKRSKTDLTPERERGKEILSNFFRSLPVDVRFNVSNLRSHSRNQVAPVLVMLHCMFHSLVCLLHRPSLVHSRMTGGNASSAHAPGIQMDAADGVGSAQSAMQTMLHGAGGYTENGFPAECASSARSISDMLSFSRLMDERTILCNPYMDHAIFIGAVALLDELDHAVQQQQQQQQQRKPPPPDAHANPSRLREAEQRMAATDQGMEVEMLSDKFEVTREALCSLSHYWGGIRWVVKWLEDESKHVKRVKRVASASEAFYKAAPAKVKADMMRSLARLRAANRQASTHAVHAQVKQGSSTHSHERDAMGRVLSPVQRKGTRPGASADSVDALLPMHGVSSSSSGGGSGTGDVSAVVGQAGEFTASWEELEAMLNDRGLVLDGMFDFDLPWIQSENPVGFGSF